MAEPAQPKQDGGQQKTPGRSRVAEFSRGRGRPRMTVHKVDANSLASGLPGLHRIGGGRK